MKKTKEYRPGDQIHISVTRDFSETATEFFAFCREHNFNPSEVIRDSIREWLEKQKEIQRMYGEQKGKGLMAKMVSDYERSVLFEEDENE